jgi:hypothetical protein
METNRRRSLLGIAAASLFGAAAGCGELTEADELAAAGEGLTLYHQCTDEGAAEDSTTFLAAESDLGSEAQAITSPDEARVWFTDASDTVGAGDDVGGTLPRADSESPMWARLDAQTETETIVGEE